MNLLLWVGVVLVGWLVVSMLAGAFLALGAAARRRGGQEAVVLLPVLPRQRSGVASGVVAPVGSPASIGQSAGGPAVPGADRASGARG